MMLIPLRGYYAILDVGVGELDRPDELERRATQLLAAGPCCLQLRAKQASARVLRQASQRLLGICRGAGVPFCVNDRLDIALLAGAEAVHLGQEDLPLTDARGIAGRRVAIGVSTHTLEQARCAVQDGADYIGFGPVFGTRSKQNPDPTVGISLLAEVCRAVSVPVVAIGGVTPENVEQVASAGAAAAAVIAAVANAPDPTAAGRAIAAAFA